VVDLLSESSKDVKEGSGKRDIKSLVSIIPPPQSLMSKQVKVKERRVRLKYNNSVNADELYLSKALAEELGIKDIACIAVAGKKRIELKAVISDKVPPNEVWANPDAMKSKGIADNSIVTVRGV
jgi:anaerobic selenocysteine-containing dehydrogenase